MMMLVRSSLVMLPLLLSGCGENLQDKNTTDQVSTSDGVIYDRGGLTNPAAGDASNRPEWPVPESRKDDPVKP